MMFSETAIEKILKIYRGFYLFTIGLGVLGVLLLFFLWYIDYYREPLSSRLFIFLLPILISWGLYWGIKNRKSWIVPVMILWASLGIINFFILGGPQSGVFNYQLTNGIYILIKFLLGLWGIFTIYFFTRKEVRFYFKSKEVFLF